MGGCKLLLSPCSPPRVVLVVVFVDDHEMWIPSVGLPVDGVTAECIATSEKASPRLSWPVFLSRQECYRGALSRRDLGLVVVALTVTMISRRLRREQ
ncbi:hypothetical protein Taro_040015 [Colocasia esculenta]|uniref:Uncharacterized protein n=1 Tax=Colocasia esculenta TaxID=4460 RepID=A0A843WKJ9_COLES|nr:hypothetical protein [Colocasia esculenta]